MRRSSPCESRFAQSRVAIVTTAAPFDPAKGDQGPGAKYNGGAKFYSVYDGDTSKPHDLRISHIAYDRVHTSADDSGTWFPLPQLQRLASEGGSAKVAPRFFGAPTNRSHRVTIETDAPEILARCRDDKVDAAVLVPNCPVCHQTISLVARHLEANGISTVVMGCAKDIVEHAAVPRFLFSDFPLGNSAGKPHDPGSQAFTLELALRLLETAPGPQTTVQSPLRWSADASWKRDYNNVATAQRRGAGAAAARVRCAEGNRARIARERGVRPFRRPKAPDLRFRPDRFTLTLHFAGRGLSPAAKPGKVPSLLGDYSMLDRRQSARDKVIYGGVAEIGERGATRDCVVRNISENGAGIEFSNAVKLHCPKSRCRWPSREKAVRSSPGSSGGATTSSALRSAREAIRTAGLRPWRTAAPERAEKAAASAPHQRALREG